LNDYKRLPDLYRDLTRRLQRVDMLLLRAVLRQRARPAVHQKGQYWGQFITDDEVDALLQSQGEIDLPVGANLDGLDDELHRTISLRDAIVPHSRIHQMRVAFDLDGDDIDLMLLAIAPEISSGYGKLFAYLNDDLNRPYLTVDLATRVLRTRRRERLTLQNRMLPDAPMVRQRLLVLTPDPGRDPQAHRRVMVPPRVLHWLLTPGRLPTTDGASRLEIHGTPFVPETCRSRIDQLREALPPPPDAATIPDPHPLTIAIVGGTRGMREGVAMAVAKGAHRDSVVRVEVDRCKHYLENPWELVRDLRLNQDIAYIVGIPDFSEDPETREKMMQLGTALATLPYPLCVGGKDRRALAVMLGGDRPRVDLPVGRTSTQERADAWDAALERRGWRDIDTEALAVRFSAVGGTTIDRVLDRVQAVSGSRTPDDRVVQGACREATRPRMTGLVQHVIPRYTWDDLILSDRIMKQLMQLEEVLAQQETVMMDWGMSRIRPRGYGLKALFSGSPGTGKTMCAEVIAGSLGYDLFKVDLSSVVSKWVGETEKNLRQIFDAAEGGTSVLLFDEGDAIFGSRGDNKSAQDKYANQEVAYLLQRLEVFEGCAIITTNLQDNIDEAFLRRFGAIVEFPFPSPRERQRLWERALPEAFMADDIDAAVLGKEFHLAGGSIVNAAINACIDAAKDGERVGMRHCIVAVARELHKMSKQVNRVHFGRFYEEVRDLFG
jgi:AAA+ superfamily predicted ATPase